MQDLELHHIGVATNNIEREFNILKKIGYQKISDIFCDKAQGIKGLFISAPHQPVLELLENTENSSTLDLYINKGIKFYHFAYKTCDIESDLKRIVDETKAIIIKPIMNATFFRRVCFLMLRNMMLIELVEEKE